jgi:Do/DeqQ family serine protease
MNNKPRYFKSFGSFVVICFIFSLSFSPAAFADADLLENIHQFFLHLFDKKEQSASSVKDSESNSKLDKADAENLKSLIAEARDKAAAFGSFSGLVKKTAPAVVDLYASHVAENRIMNPFMGDPFFEFFFGALGPLNGIPQKEIIQSSGSGVLISADGILVTCAHVVQDAQKVKARLTDGREFETDILKVDRQQDLAILKLKNIKKIDLPYLPIGDSDTIEVGDIVLAFGNSFGLGQTVTSGIISALSRVLNGRLLIQTDAAVNPGNSGGALVNIKGQLIGIPNAILSKTGASHGIGFAIPSVLVQAMLRATSQGGEHSAWFGIYTQTLTPELAASLNDKNLNLTKGAIIVDIHPDSAAKAAGLRKEDIITAIDDKPVFQAEDIHFRQLLTEPQKDVSFSIWRDGKTEKIVFKVIAPPETPSADATKLEGKHILTGLTIENLSPAVALRYDLDERKTGVVISKTSSAKLNFFNRFEFVPGDIIRQVNETKIDSTSELKKLLSALPLNGIRVLVLERSNQQFALKVG